MTKTETLRQLAAASNEKRIERLASQIETLRQARLRSVEDLAQQLEPLAQAMASLVDETRQTLSDSVKVASAAAATAEKAAQNLVMAGSRMEWTHYATAALIGATSAMLVTGFWLWVVPPRVQNLLDAKAVAELLAPHLQSRSK